LAAQSSAHVREGEPLSSLVAIAVNAESILITLIVGAIIIQALLSWFMPSGAGYRFMMLLSDISDPILRPIRSVIPPLGGFDLSPFIAILLLYFVVGPILTRLTLLLAGA
jgi:YggT family protein